MHFNAPTISPAKIFLCLVFIFFTALTFFSREIPFFWDGENFSRYAHYYYENNFIISPPSDNFDFGMLLHWLYVAMAWKIFGKTLLVSHIALLPLLLGIAWEYYKLAKKILPPHILPAIFLLLIFEPTFITQSILMGYDISKLYLYLLALNSLLIGKGVLYFLSITLLVFCSTRGIIMASSLVLLHAALCLFFKSPLSHKKQYSFRREIIGYCIPFCLFTAWLLWHYHKTGRMFFPPHEEWLSSMDSVTTSIMFRKCVYIVWQLLDFGRVFIWVFIGIGISYLKMKNKLSAEIKKMLLLLFCPLFVFILIMSPIQNPSGHRYFLILFLLSHILLCLIIHHLFSEKKYFYFLVSFFCIGLMTGNFWMYGGGFSNGWDSSLKSIPYFNLKNKMIEYINEQKINPLSVGTKFPLHHDLKYTDLVKKNYYFTGIGLSSIDKYKYVLLSNVSNQFTVYEKNILNTEWKLEREFQAGQVYVKLFKNPKGKSIP